MSGGMIGLDFLVTEFMSDNVYKQIQIRNRQKHCQPAKTHKNHGICNLTHLFISNNDYSFARKLKKPTSTDKNCHIEFWKMGCGASNAVIGPGNAYIVEINETWVRAFKTVKKVNHKTGDLVVKRKGWKTIRVFVSSTFKDFHSEREILVKKVIN